MGRGPQRNPTPPAAATQAAVADSVILRDQRRALYAYRMVGSVPPSDRKDYKIAVNDLGANLMRLKLAGAMAALERRNDGGSRLLLDHLGDAGIPGLEGTNRDSLPDRARGLVLDAYILATREMMQVATWLKRAVQATFEEG